MDPSREFDEIAYFQRRIFSYMNSKTNTKHPLRRFDVVSFSRHVAKCGLYLAWFDR